MDIEKLWLLVFHGSPMTAALALVLLDKELNGKVTELAERILRGEYKMRWIKNTDELFKLLLEKEKKETVKSPIAFVDGKLYYFVPIAKENIKNENVKAKKGERGGRRDNPQKSNSESESIQVITYLGVLGFAQGIAIAPSKFYTSDSVAYPQSCSKYFAHLDFEIGDVQFIFYKNQDVQLKELVKEAVIEGKTVCKSDTSEIFTLVDKLLYYIKYDDSPKKKEESGTD